MWGSLNVGVRGSLNVDRGAIFAHNYLQLSTINYCYYDYSVITTLID